MMVVVSYDVATSSPEGPRRLRRVAKVCENHGLRVQNSVFECLLAPNEWVVLRSELMEIADLSVDSLRFYFLGSKWQGRVEHHGAKSVPNLQDDVLIL
ncbi:MAG: CRISPR-associated endonuclease Cas2 [Opitutales bacterium]